MLSLSLSPSSAAVFGDAPAASLEDNEDNLFSTDSPFGGKGEGGGKEEEEEVEGGAGGKTKPPPNPLFSDDEDGALDWLS